MVARVSARHRIHKRTNKINGIVVNVLEGILGCGLLEVIMREGFRDGF